MTVYEEYMRRVARKVTKLRADRGWTYEELAHYSHLATSTVRLVERGSNVRVETWLRVAHALDTTLEGLIADDGE